MPSPIQIKAPPHYASTIERLLSWWRNLGAMPITRALRRLRRGMQDHSDYAYSWQCSFAMLIYDHCDGKMDIHECNRIGDVIMDRFFDVKMNKVREELQREYQESK